MIHIYYLTPEILEKLTTDQSIETIAENVLKMVNMEHLRRTAYDKMVEKLTKCKNHIPTYLYVYCTAAETQLVGNRYGPLLRVKNVVHDGRKTDVGMWESPHYKPVSRHYFNQIEVDIRDELGCPVSFADGRVIVTLHFKRMSS